MPNYWVVGAMFAGEDDQYEKFINDGYWRLGHKRPDQPTQCDRRDQMRPGDRIAIKRMLGAAASEIEIRATGIVMAAADKNYENVQVNWIERDTKRKVPARGCFASIHGPFEEDDEWTKEVFRRVVALRDTDDTQAMCETQD